MVVQQVGGSCAPLAYFFSTLYLPELLRTWKMDGNDLLSIPQAAKILGIGPPAVGKAIKKRQLVAFRCGHSKLILRTSLEAYKRTRRVGRPPGSRAKKTSLFRH